MRYQIVYMKQGLPLTTWADDADRAQRLAAQLRRAGYSVMCGSTPTKAHERPAFDPRWTL